MADGTGMMVYSSLALPCRIRSVPVEIYFRVASIAEDAILGMSFFKENECQLALDQGVLSIKGQQLHCTDRVGNAISARVQVTKRTSIPANTEVHLDCRIIGTPARTTGTVEQYGNRDHGIMIGHTVVTLRDKGQIPVRCINPHETPVTLTAGTTIGLFASIHDDQIVSTESTPDPHRPGQASNSSSRIPEPSYHPTPHWMGLLAAQVTTWVGRPGAPTPVTGLG